MRDRDVHAVGIVVGDVLPVHLARAQRDAALGDELFHAIGRELFGVGRHHLSHARQAGLEADEDEAGKISCSSATRPWLVDVEALNDFALRHADQLAVELVAPRVIRADDAVAAVALRSVEQARSAMAADIVKAAELAVLAAHGDDRFAEHVERVIVAGLRECR